MAGSNNGGGLFSETFFDTVNFDLNYVTVNNNHFTNLTAVLGGGGVSLSDIVGLISNNIFINCSTPGFGGALYM